MSEITAQMIIDKINDLDKNGKELKVSSVRLSNSSVVKIPKYKTIYSIEDISVGFIHGEYAIDVTIKGNVRIDFYGHDWDLFTHCLGKIENRDSAHRRQEIIDYLNSRS